MARNRGMYVDYGGRRGRRRRRGPSLGTVCGILIVIILAVIFGVLAFKVSQKNINDLPGVPTPTPVPGTPTPVPTPTPSPTPTVTPTPTPIPKKKVAVDPGHGGNEDFGSSRPSENQYEKHANLAIALFLKEELESRGYDVYMIRETDEAVENKQRPIMAKENGADIFVSIHLNSLDEDSDATRGAETLYSDLLNAESAVLAQYVIDELTQVIDTRHRGIKLRNGLVVLNSNELPACIVECGFMSSATERAKLFDAEYQKKIAEGIANGIEKFLPVE